MLLVLSLLLLLPAWPVFAGNEQKVVDMADLLDEEEEKELQERLLEIADTYACDVAVVTTNSYGGQTARKYTDDYYYMNGYGFGEELDGLMLTVSMGDREYYISTRGAAIDMFTDYGLERMKESFSGYLSDGAYAKAFETFADRTEEYILEAKKDRPYDVDHVYREKMGLGMRLLIASAAALLASGAVMFGLMRQLKSVGAKGSAQEYVRPGSFRVTHQRDLFLYRTVTRTRREKPSGGQSSGGGSSTHSASGGRSGGSGGSF